MNPPPYDARHATTLIDRDDDRLDKPWRPRSGLNPGDRGFRGLARAGGTTVLVLMSLVGAFLLYRAWQALGKQGWSFVTTQTWEPEGDGGFGIAAVLVGSIMIAVVAISFALPLSVGAALYISEYAPRRVKGWLISLVDLMAAVPSVVYGIWGMILLQWQILDVSRWIATYLGWVPFFHVDNYEFGNPLETETVFTSSTFIAGIVVAMMVTPIACSVMREAFTQAPLGEREGAYALGATRWGMIRTVVLPFGRGAMIGGTMLGLGRALGETIAVVLIISPVFAIQPHILEKGANSVAALIALRYGDATEMGISALMAAGLALFLMTLVVNFLASTIVARSRSGAVSE